MPSFKNNISEISEFKLDYLVCRILRITPSQLGDIDPIDIGFLKAGLIWELEESAKRGPLLML